MRMEKQLAVFLENKPGTLARMCRALGHEGINVLALTVSDTVDHAVVRMVVDKAEEALHLLGSSGVLVVESEVLVIEVANRPGALAKLAEALADSGINIEYAYGTGMPDQASGMIVLRTNDPERALEVLSQG